MGIKPVPMSMLESLNDQAATALATIASLPTRLTFPEKSIVCKFMRNCFGDFDREVTGGDCSEPSSCGPARAFIE